MDLVHDKTYTIRCADPESAEIVEAIIVDAVVSLFGKVTTWRDKDNPNFVNFAVMTKLAEMEQK